MAGRMSFRPGLPYMRQRWDALKCSVRCSRVNSIMVEGMSLGLVLLSGLPMHGGGDVFDLSKKRGGEGGETGTGNDFLQKGTDKP